MKVGNGIEIPGMRLPFDALIAAAIIIAASGAGLAYAYLTATGPGTNGALAGTSAPWGVTVGAASRTLYPGLDATVPYTVGNNGAGPQHLNGTTVQFKSDGVVIYDMKTNSYVDGCLSSWFRVGSSSIPVGVDVRPGATLSGSVDIAFDDLPTNQDACKGVVPEVDVRAT
jgi:hypothetical protein